MYCVYLLLLKNKQIYTGFTTNIRQRISDHKSGRVKSTVNRRPLRLVHYEIYLLEEDARRREKFLKTSDGKKLIKQQLSCLFKKIK